jgi:hypothetical protein
VLVKYSWCAFRFKRRWKWWWWWRRRGEEEAEAEAEDAKACDAVLLRPATQTQAEKPYYTPHVHFLKLICGSVVTNVYGEGGPRPLAPVFAAEMLRKILSL